MHRGPWAPFACSLHRRVFCTLSGHPHVPSALSMLTRSPVLPTACAHPAFARCCAGPRSLGELCVSGQLVHVPAARTAGRSHRAMHLTMSCSSCTPTQLTRPAAHTSVQGAHVPPTSSRLAGSPAAALPACSQLYADASSTGAAGRDCGSACSSIKPGLARCWGACGPRGRAVGTGQVGSVPAAVACRGVP